MDQVSGVISFHSGFVCQSSGGSRIFLLGVVRGEVRGALTIQRGF